MNAITIDGLRESVAADRPQRAGQLERAERLLAEHPEGVILECSDEQTGERFGKAKRRAGECAKLGHTTFRYQCWFSWSPADVRDYRAEK